MSSLVKREIVTLENLGDGAVGELFSDALKKIIENMVDPNTKAITKRGITIKVMVKPTEDREMGFVTVETTTKLAPICPFETRMFIGRGVDGSMVAHESNPKQNELPFDASKVLPENVKPFERKEKVQ